jgi:hypothetical protein
LLLVLGLNLLSYLYKHRHKTPNPKQQLFRAKVWYLQQTLIRQLVTASTMAKKNGTNKAGATGMTYTVTPSTAGSRSTIVLSFAGVPQNL